MNKNQLNYYITTLETIKDSRNILFNIFYNGGKK